MLHVIWLVVEGQRIARSFFKKTGADLLEEHKDAILDKIMSGPGGSRGYGTRIWPLRSSPLNKTLGVRMDWGGAPVLKDGKRFMSVNLQINNEAESAALKEAASGNRSHAKRCSIEYECDEQGRPVVERPVVWDGLTEHVFNPIRDNGI